MKLAFPTVNQLIGTAITIAILFLAVRLVAPESVKAYFRV